MFIAKINRSSGVLKVKKAKTNLALIMEFLERLKHSWKNTTEMVLLWKRTEDVIACCMRNHTEKFLNQSSCIYKAKQGSVEEIIHLEKKNQAYI